MPTRSEIILGIHCGYMHDANAALVVNGELRAAVLQERMSRNKKDPYFPTEAIRKCCELADVALNQIDLVATAAVDIQYQPRQASVDYFNGNGGYFTSSRVLKTNMDRLRFLQLNLRYNFNKMFGVKPFDRLLRAKLHDLGIRKDVELLYCDHHICHAASVFFLSGSASADTGYIFAIDSYGDGKSVSAYKFGPNNEFPIKILEMPHIVSPGRMYSSVTTFLGMKPNRHEGKVTGLAGYGDPKPLYHKAERYLKYNRKTKMFEIPCCKEPFLRKYIRRAKIVLGIGVPKHNDILTRMQEDFKGDSKENIAAAVQRRFDDEITKFVKDVIGSESPGNILLVGGIFANVRTNALVAEMYPKSTVIIHPGMTDEGVGVGAALYADYKRNNHSQRRKLKDVYLGSHYNAVVIKAFVDALDKRKYDIHAFRTGTPDGEREVARLIADGKVVGLFQGGMEYGPRALGNRTILADPRDGTVNDWLNKRLNRTEYMPFAPVVMKEYADEVFVIRERIRYTCNFMTIIVDVKPEWQGKIPGVVHVDKTARPQIIKREVNRVYYDIIKSFYELTGIPLLINTSFNAHEQPILEHPKHAINSLDQKCIDYVFLYPHLISLTQVQQLAGEN